jgi:mono/diheme cytochrome c family protein
MTLGIWRRGDPVHRSQRAGHRGGRLVRWRHRARAYSPPRQRVPSRPGDPFEPVRAETPAPIPTWAWVLLLLVAAWGMWYVATEFRTYREWTMAKAPASSPAPSAPGAPGTVSQPSSASLGEQVYGNKCAACHQLTGQGLQGVFPPLKGSAVVTSSDPTEHIRTVLRGLTGKTIDGVAYATAMPPSPINSATRRWRRFSTTSAPAGGTRPRL